MTLRDQGITNPKEWATQHNIQTVKPSPKHRYFYFVGSSRQKKQMTNKLSYDILTAYPKCIPARYDDGDRIEKAILEKKE